jgi:ammonia channel protein AmtB
LGFVMVGAGILWVGWNGFNGGDPVSTPRFATRYLGDAVVSLTPLAL